MTRCGYGRLTWPDGAKFEGFWLNGQAVSIGVFRNADKTVFEGAWQQDKATGLSVFRQQGTTERKSGSGIEVWSDGSYYCGGFSEGIK
jgi:hypothetical protein